MNFTGNQALAGSAIYTNELTLCSWANYSPPYFSDTHQVLRWPSIIYRYVVSEVTILLCAISKMLVMAMSRVVSWE